MTTADHTRYLRRAWLLLAAFGLFRFFYSGTFLLTPDETNYWQWARHLDWGYHDQTPMIGWAIWLATEFMGHTERAVRLPSVVAVTVASFYLVAMAGRWLGAKAALQTALLSQSVLLFTVGGLLATADGIQAAGWAAASYHVARGYEEDSWSQWLLGGLWFGFGFLSKYTMGVFLPCAFVFGLLSPRHRSRLAGIKPYAGVLLGLLMFLPVIYWNARNDWNSLRHVAYLGGANEPFALHLKYLGEFLGSQAGLLSPVLFVLIIAAWFRVVRHRTWQEHWIHLYLLCTSLPMVLLFVGLSLHTRVYGNWPGAGYLTASLLVVASFASGQRTDGGATAGRAWRWAVATSYAFTCLVLLQVHWPVLPLPVDMDRASYEIQGWDEIGGQAGEIFEKMPQPERTFLFGMRYQYASELAFYVPGQPQTVSINRFKRPNVYDYWWRDEDLLGWDGVGLLRKAEDARLLEEVFERVEPPQAVEIFRTPLWPGHDMAEKPVKVVYLIRAYGFKGGLRWQPKDRGDVRAH